MGLLGRLSGASSGPVAARVVGPPRASAGGQASLRTATIDARGAMITIHGGQAFPARAAGSGARLPQAQVAPPPRAGRLPVPQAPPGSVRRVPLVAASGGDGASLRSATFNAQGAQITINGGRASGGGQSGLQPGVTRDSRQPPLEANVGRTLPRARVAPPPRAGGAQMVRAPAGAVRAVMPGGGTAGMAARAAPAAVAQLGRAAAVAGPALGMAGGAALALAGPLAALVLAVGAAVAVFTLFARRAGRQAEELSAYSAVIARARARAMVATIQQRVSSARIGGSEIARFIEVSNKLQVTVTHILDIIQRDVLRILNPLLEMLEKILTAMSTGLEYVVAIRDALLDLAAGKIGMLDFFEAVRKNLAVLAKNSSPLARGDFLQIFLELEDLKLSDFGTVFADPKAKRALFGAKRFGPQPMP